MLNSPATPYVLFLRCYSRSRRSCTEAFSKENQVFIVYFFLSVSHHIFSHILLRFFVIILTMCDPTVL